VNKHLLFSLDLSLAHNPLLSALTRPQPRTRPSSPRPAQLLLPLLTARHRTRNDSRRLQLLLDPRLLTLKGQVVTILDRDGLGHVVNFVDADETLGKLKHVVAQRDDNKLRVFRPLFDVSGYD
jgi:hypothetical protein